MYELPFESVAVVAGFDTALAHAITATMRLPAGAPVVSVATTLLPAPVWNAPEPVSIVGAGALDDPDSLLVPMMNWPSPLSHPTSSSHPGFTGFPITALPANAVAPVAVIGIVSV